MKIPETYCILDIECWQPTGKPDVNTAELRYCGIKSCTGAYRIFHFTEADAIRSALRGFSYVVGHNLINYDIPVLNKYGYRTSGIVIDTYQIVDRRAKSMMYIDLNQGDRSLAKLLERFELPVQKGTFDYSLLKNEVLIGNEYSDLEKYLKGDLDGSDALFNYFYEFFSGFKGLVNSEDQRKMAWLKSSPGAVTYKVICNLADIPEEYGDKEERKGVQYEGGFVSPPENDYYEGDIHCYDFKSLYPHCFIGGNLYSLSSADTDWNGSGVYPNIFGNDMDGIRGHYSREQGRIEEIIQYLFNERNKIPKTDKRNLAYKIVINTAYGISGDPKFKSLYNLTTASDCTALARRTIKHARTVLQEKGYKCIYTDTDSIFVYDPYKDKERLDKLIEWISEEQRKSFNIYIPSHNLEHECNIKRIYFFRKETGVFSKKHYIYVKDDDSITVKGMQVIKGTASPLSKKILEEVIKPMIINKEEVVKDYDYWKEIYQRYATEHPELLVKRYRVWPLSTYENSTSLQSQISKRYGEGEHFLVLNSRIGAGKGNRYAKVEELKEKLGEDWYKVIKVNAYMKDIIEFINYKQRGRLAK